MRRILGALPSSGPGGAGIANQPVRESSSPDVPQLSLAGNSLSDAPTEEDLLGFAPYVDAVAQFLVHPATKTPLTVSVEAPWGTGKTSFLRQLAKRLMQRGADPGAPHVVAVHFNPWRSQSDEALWASFALSVEQALRKDARARGARPWRKRVSEHRWEGLGQPLAVAAAAGAVLVANRLGWTDAALLTLAGVENAFAEAALTVGALSATAVGARKAYRDFRATILRPVEADIERQRSAPDYAGKLHFFDKFQEDFAQTLLDHGENVRVVVLMDDLDRCEPMRVAELMRAVNLMIPDHAPVMYVLAMDREKVAAAIAAKHKDILPLVAPPARAAPGSPPGEAYRDAALDFGYAFLEKFIQVPFALPRPDEQSVARYIEALGRKPPSPAAKPSPAPETPAAATQASPAVKVGLAEVPAQPQFQRGKLRAALDEDSRELKALAQMAAPALDHNPRRIKQYVNVFRLQAFIANEAGILQEDEKHVPAEGLTLTQLAKFVALGTGWPRLLAAAQGDPTLLTRVELEAWRVGDLGDAVAYYTGGDAEPSHPAAERWAREQGVVRLLCARVSPDPETLGRVSLHGAYVGGLLQTMPRVERYADAPIPPVTFPGMDEVDALLGKGQVTDALKRLEDAVRRPDVPAAARLRARLWLAEGRLRSGERERALDEANEARALAASLGSRLEESMAISLLAQALAALGKMEDAQAAAADALRRLEGLGGPEAAGAYAMAGDALEGLRSPLARVARTAAFDINRRVHGPEHGFTIGSLVRLARTLAREGQRPEASRLLREARATLLEARGPQDPLVKQLDDEIRFVD